MERRTRALLAISLALNAIWLPLLGWRLIVRLLPGPSAVEDYRSSRRDLLAVLDARPGDVVFVGASLTDRGEWTELFEDDLPESHRSPRPRIVNRGIAGDTTLDVLARLDPILAARPRALFLMVGINDLAQGASPAAVAERYARILSAIRAASPASDVVVQSLLPVNLAVGQHGVDNQRVAEVNRLLRALCAERGCTFADVAPPLRDASGALDEGLTHDGLHLNGAGYRRWAAALAPLVEAARGLPPSVEIR